MNKTIKDILFVLIVILFFIFASIRANAETISTVDDYINEIQIENIVLYKVGNETYDYKPYAVQAAVHEIAENARLLGLDENNPIIKEAQRLWWEAEKQIEEDIDILATVIYNEAWGGCSTRHRELVGAVVLNRYKSDIWPNTIYDIVMAPNQYRTAYCDPNSSMYKRARSNLDNWKTCQNIAVKVLKGQVNCDPGVVYQSNFIQGKVYVTHYTSYSTTYFCYGRF